MASPAPPAAPNTPRYRLLTSPPTLPSTAPVATAIARGDLPSAAVAPMPYLPVETGAAADAALATLPLSAACMRTLMVSSGWIVLCDAARAVAPAMTSVTGNTDAMLPSKPVVDGAVIAEASTKPPPRRLRRPTRRRGRLTRAWRSTGRPGAYCSAAIVRLAKTAC